MKCKFATLLVLVLISVAAWAHNGMDHVIGTVSKLTDTGITVVQEKDHTALEVVTTQDTTYERDKKPAHRADLKVGDRVVIHAMKMSGHLQAHEVQFADVPASVTHQP
jgi:Domain of unknown function (DUF5666)